MTVGIQIVMQRMIAPEYSLITPPIGELFSLIGKLDANRFQTLLSLTQQDRGFDVSSGRDEEVGALTGIQPYVVSLLFPLLAALYQRLNDTKVPDDKAREALSPFVDSIIQFDEKEGAEKRNLVERLALLLRPNEAVSTSNKMNRLRIGLLKNATGFSSLVDIRPNFDDERQSIVAMLPVVQFCITTDSDDPTEKRIVIQLDEEAIQALKEVVEDIEDKLRVLNSSVTKT